MTAGELDEWPGIVLGILANAMLLAGMLYAAGLV